MLPKFNFDTKIFKIIASLALLYFYIFWLFGWLMYTIVFAIIGFTIYAYLTDKTRLERGNERFRGDNLFFRYGEAIDTKTLPIPIKEHWRTEDSINFVLPRVGNGGAKCI